MNRAVLFVVFVLLYYCCSALAVQTQVNEVSDLFDRHIEGKDELLQNLKAQNDDAIERIRSGAHHDAIEGIKDAEGKVGELNSIKESDLDMEGRRLRSSTEYQFYDENELEPDYTKPGNIMHKQDADDITSATEESLRKIGRDLMQKLKELGFNCKTVKGPTHKEPVYYIDIRREERTNTEYDQFFCEEPRNTYNCSDSVSLKCIRHFPPELQSLLIPFSEVKGRSHWGDIYLLSWQWKIGSGEKWEFKFKNADEIKLELKQLIVAKTEEDISFLEIPNQNVVYNDSGDFTTLVYNQRGIEWNMSRYQKVTMPESAARLRFYYYKKQRSCMEWKEDRIERCVLR